MITDPKKACIWWLDQNDCESGTTDEWKALPPYIFREYQSRLGRNGRGRLWVSSSIFGGSAFQVPDKHFTGAIGERLDQCGGIVILRSDLPALARLPGLVTDFELNRLGVA